MCAQRRLKSACASVKSAQTLHSPHEFTLHTWLSKMRPAKILISLRECAGWSESSPGAHVRRYFFYELAPHFVMAIDVLIENEYSSTIFLVLHNEFKQNDLTLENIYIIVYSLSIRTHRSKQNADQDQRPQHAVSDHGIHNLPPLSQAVLWLYSSLGESTVWRKSVRIFLVNIVFRSGGNGFSLDVHGLLFGLVFDGAASAYNKKYNKRVILGICN